MQTEENKKVVRKKKQPEKTELELKVERLENALSKMAVMTGNRAILLEFDIEPWNPSKKDMTKYNS